MPARYIWVAIKIVVPFGSPKYQVAYHIEDPKRTIILLTTHMAAKGRSRIQELPWWALLSRSPEVRGLTTFPESQVDCAQFPQQLSGNFSSLDCQSTVEALFCVSPYNMYIQIDIEESLTIWCSYSSPRWLGKLPFGTDREKAVELSIRCQEDLKGPKQDLSLKVPCN